LTLMLICKDSIFIRQIVCQRNQKLKNGILTILTTDEHG